MGLVCSSRSLLKSMYTVICNIQWFYVCRLQIQPGEQPLSLHSRGLPVLLPAQAPNDIPRQKAHEKDAGEELWSCSYSGDSLVI